MMFLIDDCISQQLLIQISMNTNINVLEEYIETLERELKAKSVQQHTLYRALESTEKELKVLDQVYLSRNQLRKEVQALKQELYLKSFEDAQLMEAKNELDWTRYQFSTMNETIDEMQRQLQSQHNKLQKLQLQNKDLELNIITLKSQIQENECLIPDKRSQNQSMKVQISELRQQGIMKNIQIQQLQDKLVKLSTNYMQVEQMALQKDKQLVQLRESTLTMKQAIDSLAFRLNQKNIMIKCLQDQLHQAEQTFKTQSIDKKEQMLKDVEKIDLLRQNNQLVERVHYMEQQNRGTIAQTPIKAVKLHTRLQALKDEFQTLSKNLQL